MCHCAFENKIIIGILIGRSYGGVAILVRDYLVNFVEKIICEERSDQTDQIWTNSTLVIICINSTAIVNVYLTTKSCKNYASTLLRSTLELVDTHLKSVDPSYIIVGGDFNTDLRTRSDNISHHIISEFVNEFNLIEC